MSYEAAVAAFVGLLGALVGLVTGRRTRRATVTASELANEHTAIALYEKVLTALAHCEESSVALRVDFQRRETALENEVELLRAQVAVLERKVVVLQAAVLDG